MSSRARSLLPWLLLAAGLAVVVLAAGAGPSEDEGVPLDPSSTGPLGTRALVEVLEELGAEVTVSATQPGTGEETALLLTEPDPGTGGRIGQWVRAGGVLVVPSPASQVTSVEVSGSTDIGGLVETELRRQCDVPAFRGIERVFAPGGVLFEVPEGARGCFRRGDGAWLLVQPLGRGTVVRLGGASALLNEELDRADNAPLLASLLAPREGTRVRVLYRAGPSLEGGGLTDLISPWVWLAFAQLGVALLVVALWRARRLGAPVVEPQPVQVDGSELVVAVGNLLHRARSRRQAGLLLAEDLRRFATQRLGLPAGAPPDQIADALAARGLLSREEALAALAPGQLGNEAALLRYARRADAARDALTGADTPDRRGT